MAISKKDAIESIELSLTGISCEELEFERGDADEYRERAHEAASEVIREFSVERANASEIRDVIEREMRDCIRQPWYGFNSEATAKEIYEIISAQAKNPKGRRKLPTPEKAAESVRRRRQAAEAGRQAAMAGKPKKPPQRLTKQDKDAWRQGWESARKRNVDSGHPEYHRRNVVMDTETLRELAPWAGNQSSFTYSLVSTGVAGDYVSPSMIDATVSELEYTYERTKDKKARKELDELIAELDAYARYSEEHSTEEAGLGDVDSGYATWLMEEEAVGNPKKKSAACKKGQIKVKRKGYTKKDGTRVKGSTFCIKDRGKPGRGPDIVPELREGKLGGPGYTKKPARTRHALLNKCVKKYDYQSCLDSLQYLLLVGKDTWSKAMLGKVEADKRWLMKKYGGPGSFGPRNNNPKRKRRGGQFHPEEREILVSLFLQEWGSGKKTKTLRVGDREAAESLAEMHFIKYSPKSRKASLTGEGFRKGAALAAKKNPQHKISKRQFESYFRDDVLPYVVAKYEEDGIVDKPARREAWNDTVDSLIWEGSLPKSAGDWSHPRWLETAKVTAKNPRSKSRGRESNMHDPKKSARLANRYLARAEKYLKTADNIADRTVADKTSGTVSRAGDFGQSVYHLLETSYWLGRAMEAAELAGPRASQGVKDRIKKLKSYDSIWAGTLLKAVYKREGLRQ